MQVAKHSSSCKRKQRANKNLNLLISVFLPPKKEQTDMQANASVETTHPKMLSTVCVWAKAVQQQSSFGPQIILSCFAFMLYVKNGNGCLRWLARDAAFSKYNLRMSPSLFREEAVIILLIGFYISPLQWVYALLLQFCGLCRSWQPFEI